METAKIKSSFLKLGDDFSLLSSEVIAIIEKSLEMVFLDSKLSIPGGLEWTMETPKSRVVVQLYFSGTMLVYLQSKKIKEPISSGIFGNQHDPKIAPDITFSFVNENNHEFEKVIQKLKTYLSN
jgi:hypothetical protein